jgi:hypothetical protein
MNRCLALMVASIGLNLMACCCAWLPQSGVKGKPLPRDLDAFVARFGQPDKDTSTETEKPLPKNPKRWLVYEKENVKAEFIGDGDQRPPEKWLLLHNFNNATGVPLSSDEFLKAMTARDQEPAPK